MKQTPSVSPPNTPGGGDGAKLGEGALLSEFSSLTRGAVTPPHLYALAVEFVAALQEIGTTW